MSKDLATLREALRHFAAERDWDQFHSPRNLAAALSVEAAELLEQFQWLSEEQSRALDPARLEAVRNGRGGGAGVGDGRDEKELCDGER